MGSKSLKLATLQIKQETQPKMFKKLLNNNFLNTALYSLDELLRNRTISKENQWARLIINFIDCES